LASIVHVPAVRKVATLFETVQTLVVVEAKATVRPELAVAESVSGVPTTWGPGLLKVMVCALMLVWPAPVMAMFPLLPA
jgi:hypothetical protein